MRQFGLNKTATYSAFESHVMRKEGMYDQGWELIPKKVKK